MPVITSSQVPDRPADTPVVLDPPQELRAEDLGARLRAVRELAGASQHDVAKAAGLTRRELQSAERGAKRLSSDQLRTLAGALGVEPDVLMGVGFEGELVRAGPGEGRIGRASGQDRELPDDLRASNPIDESWRDVRNEMGDVLASCARLTSAGSGDDVRRLIERLERELLQLKSTRTFQRRLADHERALDRARDTGGDTSDGRPQRP